MSRQPSILNSAPRPMLKFAIAPRQAAALATILALAVILTPLAQSQTLDFIHKFQNVDGAHPETGLTIDARGRLYGTTAQGGASNFGTVFRLTQVGSGWVQNVLYEFHGSTDGMTPMSRVIFGPDGTLYGTTVQGGDPHCGCGVVYRLQPPPTACKTPLCPWTETVVHTFEGTAGGNDGQNPMGDLAFGSAGNIYGTASAGGQYNYGMAYELTRSNGGWTESNVHNFTIFEQWPYSGVTLDANGNLYGTTYAANPYYGEVYELSPSGGGWTEQVLHQFQLSDGGQPYAGLILDAAGNLYGATSNYGANAGGTAFELSPSNGGWSFSVLYNFVGSNDDDGPRANLAFDQSGNLYGTTYTSGPDHIGSIFELSPGSGGWSYTALYTFTDLLTAGKPISNVVFDSAGNLYGTTSYGGNPYGYCTYGCGTVWEMSGQ